MLKQQETTVDCRYDWHQTAENAFIIVYAKEYDPKLSYIKANQIFLSVRLYFPATEQYFEKSFELYEVSIDSNYITRIRCISAVTNFPYNCLFEILRTKHLASAVITRFIFL